MLDSFSNKHFFSLTLYRVYLNFGICIIGLQINLLRFYIDYFPRSTFNLWSFDDFLSHLNYYICFFYIRIRYPSHHRWYLEHFIVLTRFLIWLLLLLLPILYNFSLTDDALYHGRNFWYNLCREKPNFDFSRSINFPGTFVLCNVINNKTSRKDCLQFLRVISKLMLIINFEEILFVIE